MREGDNLANPLEEVHSPGAMAMFPEEQGVAEGYEPGDKITWYHSNHHPEIEGTVIGWKDGHLIVNSIDPQPRNTEKTVAKYRVPKNNILSHDKQGVAEGSDGQVVFSGTGANGVKYEIIQSGDDFMIHANGRHIDSYGSLQRAMGVLKNEVPGLQQGVAEGSNDTIYPNAEVIKSKNGKPVGEIYQDGNSWGAFHYRADRGYDLIDSREDAIQALKDLHQETGRSRPDYTIKGVTEAINPDITNPEFGHQQQIGDYLYVARYWSKGLKITAYHGNKQIGYAELMYQSAPFDDFADPKTTPKRIWLESEWTRVDPKYQRQGIMSTMYAYAKMLGNSVKPSQTRSDDAKAAWKSWRQSGDAQHLTREGVAEGQCNMSEAGTSCPVHGMTECYMESVHTDPKGFAQPTGAAFESQLARIKSLALLK
jgi:GNAT superfamily N-acetyltransferase